MKRLIGFLFSLLGATAAWAQGTIEQSGPVIPFHFTAWYKNGVVGDAGSPSSPFASALGLFDGAQCPFGISSQTGPGPSLAQAALFTICQTNAATTFVFQGLNGLSSPNFFFQIGGITYPFPGPGNGDVAGPVSSVSGDLVCFNGTTGVLIADCGIPPPNHLRRIASGSSDNALPTDVTIAWDSSTASAKTEILYACTSAASGSEISIKDEYGSANTYPITVTPNGSDTIDTYASYLIGFAQQNLRIQCDGNHNWMTK